MSDYRTEVAVNRAMTKYTPREQMARLAWMFGRVIFRIIPRPLYGFRSAWLRLFGAKIGAACQIYPTVKIFAPWQLRVGAGAAIGDGAILYNLGPLTIGERATISQYTHLCGGSHDYADDTMPLIRAEIRIGNDAWVCADAFVGPGIEIGEGAVVAARSVVVEAVKPWTVVAGHPAKFVKDRLAGRRKA